MVERLLRERDEALAKIERLMSRGIEDLRFSFEVVEDELDSVILAQSAINAQAERAEVRVIELERRCFDLKASTEKARAERDEEHEGAVMAKACVVKLEDRVAVLEKDNKWLRILLGRWAEDYPDSVTDYDRAALAPKGDG